MQNDQPILVILDVDETLLHAAVRPLSRKACCAVGPYFVYRRPFLDEFLLACQRTFRLAVWSSSGSDYLEAVIRATFPHEVRPVFVWSRERCTRRLDGECHATYFVKDLKKVKRLGFDLKRVLVIEDTPQKVERHYGNAIYVTPFYGEDGDDELRRLLAYLQSFRSVPNVRTIEKRNWRSR